MRTISTLLLLGVFACGCKAVPKNDEPRCDNCTAYFDLSKPVQACPVHEPAMVTPRSDRRWENLVLEGGGVKGVAYVGAFQAMQEQGVLTDIKRIAGTSAGALLGLMVSLGYTPDEMQEIVMQLDFKKFKDGAGLGEVERLIHQYGVYKGDYAMCTLECLVEHRTGTKHTTFAEFNQMAANNSKFRRPTFFSTNVNTATSKPFSVSDTPNVSLAEAARKSMSIPFFFAARKMDGDIFVDGGVLRNYPIDYFDDEKANPDTIGLHLGGELKPTDVQGLPQFAHRIVDIIMNMQVARLCDIPDDVKRTAFLPTDNIGTTDFDITDAQKCDLMHDAHQAAVAYITNPEPSGECPSATLKMLETFTTFRSKTSAAHVEQSPGNGRSDRTTPAAPRLE